MVRMNEQVGFPEFHRVALQTLGPAVAATRSLLQIGQEMLSGPVSGELPDLAKQITQSVANSMQSALLLVCNGCGLDALRIVRAMFESGVTIHYLDNHPELAADYVDYIWVIRKKFNDYHRELPPDKVKPLAPEEVHEVLVRYEQVKGRFTDKKKKGRIRNSWCKLSLKDMADEVGAQDIYGGLYRFGSSMIHTDILAVVAGADGAAHVRPVPSEANLLLALQIAVMSYAMTLTAFDKIASLGRGDDIETAFNRSKNAEQSM
jgi:hypothetical protein